MVEVSNDGSQNIEVKITLRNCGDGTLYDNDGNSGCSAVLTLPVGQSEFADTADALTPLPWYEREEDSPSGIYLRHESGIFVASLWPYCSDSLLGSAESERGVYGRGGCLDPEERPGTP
mgnify:CR=1 FL=1